MKTKTTLNQIFVTLLLLTQLLSISSITFTRLIPEGNFVIVGKSGLCMSANNKNGRLTQQKCSLSDDLRWRAEKYSNGLLFISKNGSVIDNSYGKSDNGNHILGYQRNNSKAQIWKIEAIKENYVQFSNIDTKKCLDDYGKREIGQFYQLNDCAKVNENQWFRLLVPSKKKKLYPDGWFNIIGKTGFCVAATNKNGALTQQNCGSEDVFSWKAENHKNGLVILCKNGLVMDNFENKNANGNKTIGYQRNNSSAQVWLIYSVQNEKYVTFRNPHTNRCLDDTGAAAVGKGYHIWECSNTNRNQWFRLSPYVKPVKPVVQPVKPVVQPVTPQNPQTSDITDSDPIPYFKPYEGNCDILVLKN